jgi:predicted GNAT family acetyltransferase
MEIADSARKHGIADADMLHAIRNALRAVDQGDRTLYIGADRNGRLLEVVVLDEDEEDLAVIHAMPLRRKFYNQL